MTDAIAVVALPPEQRTVKFDVAPDLTANALYPQSDDESLTHTMKRQMCREQHNQALRAAVQQGTVTPLNPISYVAEAWRTHAQLDRAVMTRTDFQRFAGMFFIRVESSPRPSADVDEQLDDGDNATMPLTEGDTPPAPAVSLASNPPRRPQRQDDLAVELNEVLTDMRREGQRLVATAVFARLKKGAGKGGPVVDVSGDNKLIWERASGAQEMLTFAALEKRISNWLEMNPLSPVNPRH